MLLETTDLIGVTRTIQLSLAPVFLLTGIAGILNVLSGRLARVIDRARKLEASHSDTTGDEHRRHVGELRVLDRRIWLVSHAIFLCTASAIAICGVVGLLFFAGLMGYQLAELIALVFILATVLLVIGLVMFAIEVRVATKAMQIRRELLEHDQ